MNAFKPENQGISKFVKLLVIVPSIARGGAEEYALTISAAAVEEKWEVHIAFSPTNEGMFQDPLLQQAVHYHPIELKAVNERRLGRLKNRFLWLIRTLRLLLKVKPDVVLLNLPSPAHCVPSMIACALLQVPVIVMVHLVVPQITFNAIKRKVYDWLRSQNQQWVTISGYSRKLLCEKFNVSTEEILCIYNGTKLGQINYHQSHSELHSQVCQELGIPETSRILLTVARLHPQKGYSYLIPAIPHIVKEFPAVRFVWLGDGIQRDFLVEQVKTRQVEKHVLFLGHRSDVSRFLRSADLFVFPTYSEGMPFAVLEAMAAGLPVVASDTSSIPEILIDQVHGLLFRTGDSEDLQGKLFWALSNHEQMQTLAQNALLHVQSFSEEKMIQGMLQTLEQQSLCKSSQ